ncbi:ATP synthase F0 subunit 8 (mitochondrion) [Penaeus monodon]|uniref:ATP synthase protein 8 n=2 Tax=Penaeus monodon TaxID=6687 RepID=ATP8_PENMO|nr:ATP synthase F0 subunit 8 [Penaeus monodon]Q9MGD7.1 RecName: Full=ATP synthase protein 8; AltName: Full=A6L; AltName: Full=F-ATPase subunit 8 [Penaeus monodon]AAF43373.1 ATP synthase F0 subunit 8 [Penaeus monodon]QMS48411.1 ATP synthase F0 subunit 8 [Penaeus monodon]
MPQMAPLLWLNLFLMFSATFVMFIVLNYFIKVPSKIEKSSSQLQKMEMTWKW